MPTMRLPFLFRVEVTRPRHRRPETCVVSDHADFDIPGVTSAEAPVSVTWTHNDAAVAYPDSFRGKPVPRVSARTWEGRSYRPVDGADGPVGADAFESGVSNGGRYAESTLLYPSQDGFGHAHDTQRVKGCTAPDLSTWLARIGARRDRVGKDDRAVSMNFALESFKRKLLLVDGRVWSAEGVTEPHYVVVDGAGGIEVDVWMSREPLSYCHPFRADRRDDAVAWARRLAEASGRDPAGVRVTTDTLEVADVATLAFDEGVGLARQMLSHFQRSAHRLGPGPERDGIEALEAEVHELSRRGRDVPAGETLIWASHAVDACRELRVSLEAAGLDDGAFRAFAALDRWREVERERRPDMVELGRFARGAPDQAMAGFTP